MKLRHERLSVRCAVCALAAISIATGAHADPATQRHADVLDGYASTHILVRLTPAATTRVAAALPLQARSRDDDPRPFLTNAFRRVALRWGVTRVDPLYPEPFGRQQAARNLGLDAMYVLRVPVKTATPAMVAAFVALRDDVAWATVDVIGGVSQLIPDDARFSEQYALHNKGQTGGIPGADISARAAWKLHTGDPGAVTIAIIDSGVNSHFEYGTNAPPYPNGRIVEGRNTADPLHPSLTTDACHHGTHVAGIAAASGNNGLGVAGVNWGAHIMPVRVTDTLGVCDGVTSSLAAGIVWAADHGADVASMSLQYNIPDGSELAQMLQDAVDYAVSRDVLLVAAAGNSNFCGIGRVCYPARLQNVLAVAATTDDDLFADRSTTDCRCWSSNWGVDVELSAPGDVILSTWINNSFFFLNGTSMATPQVSGLASLIRSAAPELTAQQVREILFTSAEDLGEPGWDKFYGHGRINAYLAMLAISTCIHPAACDDGVFCNGAETCNPLVGCVDGPPPTCDDEVACTDDSCGGPFDECLNASDDRLCDDADPCTVDTCTALGCSNADVLCGACCDREDAICWDDVFEQDCDCELCAWTRGARCATVPCDLRFTPIPTVSQWGLVVLTLVLLVGGKIAFLRRRDSESAGI